MRVESLSLNNFRLFRQASFCFASGSVAIIGPNATGKTTLLEAIFVASAGRSPRTARDIDLVRWGESFARVDVEFRRADGRAVPVQVIIEILASGLRKRLQLAGRPVRAADLLGTIPLVLFTPADLSLAQGGPRVRRRFVNLALARLRPAYADDLARYRRVVLQRNRLLRDGAPPDQLAPWTSRLVETGARVAVHRCWFVRTIAPIAADLHSHLSDGREQLVVEYSGDLADAAGDYETALAAFRELIARRHADERLQGRTLAGPHRDDLRLLIAGRPLRTYGSQGQQRTAALALKLAEAELMSQTLREPPMLLLDDCLSELDQSRAAAVLDLASRYEQVIVTSAAESPLLAAAAQLIRLSAPGAPAGEIDGEKQARQ